MWFYVLEFRNFPTKSKPRIVVIELKNVNKYYGKHRVLKDINLTIKDGEKLVIIGPSGSGKSTTIRCMNGLEEVKLW